MTKTILLAAALSASVVGAASAADLEVFVRNLRSAEGNVVGCIWPDSAGFPDCFEQPNGLLKTIPASTPQPTLVFPNLAPGSYSVSVIHDENGDGKLDAEGRGGIYAEGVGTSNNARKRLGPPEFRKTDFKIRRDTGVDVDVFYYLKKR